MNLTCEFNTTILNYVCILYVKYCQTQSGDNVNIAVYTVSTLHNTIKQRWLIVRKIVRVGRYSSRPQARFFVSSLFHPSQTNASRKDISS